MDRNFAETMKLVLKHEGNFSDHPQDPGGATMKGITLATFRRYVDRKATKDDLRNITQAQLQDVYKRHYWNAVRADDLPDGVDYAAFDFAVNSGPSRAARYLQAAVGVRQDGKIGPQTIAAVKACMAPTVINDLCDRRMAFLRGLETWPTFRKGWTSRVTDVRAKALQMAARTVAGIPTAPVINAPPESYAEAVAAQQQAQRDMLAGKLVLTRYNSTAATPAAPTGWLSLILSLFRKGA